MTAWKEQEFLAKGETDGKIIILTDPVVERRGQKNNVRIRTADLQAVRDIREEGFSGCTAMRAVTLGRLQKLGKGAFSGCSKLKEAILPPSLTYMGKAVFRDNRRLSTAFFDRNCPIRTIPADSFSGCAALQRVELPRHLREIEDRAFYKCKELEELELPISLRRIGREAFYNCGFRELELPEGLVEIGEGAFRKCRNLEYIYLPDTLRKIGKWAFHGCTNLKVLEINHDPEEIGEWLTNKSCTIRCPKGSRMEEDARKYGMEVEYR